jgi:hypothetical protein
MNVLDVTGHAYMKNAHIGRLKDFIVTNATKKISFIGGMDSNFALTV